MIEIDDKLVSLDVVEEAFVCDLTACKGACCVEGDSGAPLTDEELPQIEAAFKQSKSYLRPEGIAAIEAQGAFVKDADGEWVTPLRDGKECAYTVFDSKGMAMCGIELAWKDGHTSFRKPVSCHLYPIRTKRYSDFEAVNYERWSICSPACTLGKELKVPVYKFAKEALIRKYGEQWYSALEQAADELDKMDLKSEKNK
ncbi:MAG: DUF3109 family protein [Salibacteraceae bacterium]